VPDVSDDLYAVLGLTSSATAEEIRSAHRRIVRECHPDANGGKTDRAKQDRFRRATEAWDVLGDEIKRREYDASRASKRRSSDRSSRFAGRGEPRTGKGIDLGEVIGFDLDMKKIFQAFAGSLDETERDQYERETTGPSRVREEQRDSEGDLRIDFAQAILGCVASVSTPSGTVSAKIPAGTPSGKRLRLRGRGIGGGDHYAIVQIDVPRSGHAKEEVARLLRDLEDRER